MTFTNARTRLEARWAATPMAAKGVFLVSAGSIGLVLMAALAKYLGSRLPPFEILFFRSAVGFICALWVFRSDLMEPLRTKRPGAHFFRGLVGAGGNACFFWTITHMMLADSLALQFSRPLWMIPLALCFLSEVVGFRRIAVATVGFAGILMYARPFTEGFDPNAIVGAFGGLFAQLDMWRGAFWALVLMTSVFTYLAWKITPQSEAHGRFSVLPYRRLLILGAAVLALSLTSQTDDPTERFVLFALAMVLSVWSFWRDSHAGAPMFPRQAMNLFSQMGALHWIVALSAVTTVLMQSFMTLHLQVLRGLPPIYASYFLMILALSWSVSSIVVSHLRADQEVRVLIGGLAISLIGAIGAAATVVDGNLALFGLAVSATGFGIGLTTPPIMQRTVRVAPLAEKALAGSSIHAVRNVGISFGAAGAGWIVVSAGLTSTAMSHEIVARAMLWVYEADVLIAALTLIAAIPLFVAARGDRDIAN